MKHQNFPPFPATGEKGPQVCASVRFYLAIKDDLSSEEVHILSAHVQECTNCAAEFRLLQHTTRLISALPGSAPSVRVDEAIRALVQIQNAKQGTSVPPPRKIQTTPRVLPFGKKLSAFRHWPGVLVAALLLLVFISVLWRGQIFPTRTPLTFQLPVNLSWNGYVLHYTQTRVDEQRKSYLVEVYQDLGTNQMHIESMMPGQFDVVVVSDASTIVGEDIMHNVAQTGRAVETWAVDGSLFHLALLRQALNTHRAIYLGKSKHQGEEVYQVQASNGQVLLLNTDYLPIGALRDLTNTGSGTPLYETCELMSSTQVSDSMWDMQIPPHFRMGNLPSSS